MLSTLDNQKFKQKIKLIELTKQLEREPCDSLSFTHRIRDDAVSSSVFVTRKSHLSARGKGEAVSSDLLL